MELAEKETIILINQADKAQGFFSFGTSEESHFKRMCKIVGDKNILSIKLSTNPTTKKVSWWDVKVNIQCLNEGNWGISRLSNLSKRLTANSSPRKDCPK